jgi:hypothetical protein
MSQVRNGQERVRTGQERTLKPRFLTAGDLMLRSRVISCQCPQVGMMPAWLWPWLPVAAPQLPHVCTL